MTHDYKRHGTTTLFAALGHRTGEVIHLEFLRETVRPGTRPALHPRQLRHAQACQGEGLAGQAPPGALPLRAHLVFVAEPRRALPPNSRSASSSASQSTASASSCTRSRPTSTTETVPRNPSSGPPPRKTFWQKSLVLTALAAHYTRWCPVPSKATLTQTDSHSSNQLKSSAVLERSRGIPLVNTELGERLHAKRRKDLNPREQSGP